jgi:hypothetical protein
MNEEADGTIYFVTSSDNVDYDVPETPGVIRAYTAISGVMLKPDPSDANKCIMYTCVEIDLKGGIPEFAMRQALKDQGYQIDKIRKVLPKWKKLFPGDTPN